MLHAHECINLSQEPLSRSILRLRLQNGLFIILLKFYSYRCSKLRNRSYPKLKLLQNGNRMKTELLEEFVVKGHENVKSTHATTLEFTMDSQLTPRGTCILGMESPKSCLNLKEETKHSLRTDKKFLVKLQSSGFIDEFIGYGHPNLTLTHPHDMVFRKSTYICTRTIMIACSKAANDINRDIVNVLKNPSQQVTIQIYKILEE